MPLRMQPAVQPMQIRLPRDLWQRLADRATRENTDLNTLIVRAVAADFPGAPNPLQPAPSHSHENSHENPR